MSTPEKATAIVLRTYDFSETSVVATLFTREFGKVRALAKGAKRPKGPFESSLDLLSLCRIVFLRKSTDVLDLLTEAKLERRVRCRDLTSLYAAYYVAELLNELTDDHDPHPDLFDVADETLQALSEGVPVPAVVLRWELSALRLLGHLPSLEVCAECGEEVAETPRVAFGQLSGGILCSRCRMGKRQVVSMRLSVLQSLRRFAQPDLSKTDLQSGVDPAIWGELRGLLNLYFSNLLGRRPRMYDYLKTLASPRPVPARTSESSG